MNLHVGRFAFSRRGVTLLELLVTIGIILAITAAVIPVMAPVMAGRRLREATRGVDAFISSARNKALTSGHAVGVSFERLEAEPQAATVLSLVEVPPPWSGDTASSLMRVDARGRIIGFVQPGGAPSGDIGWINLVRQGDVVQLNNRNTSFQLWLGEPYQDLNSNGQWDNGEPYLDTTNDGTCQYNPTRGATLLQSPAPEPSAPGSFSVMNDSILWTLSHSDSRTMLKAPKIAAGDYAFKIIRQPVKSSSQSFQLPVGTVIDLSMSGDDSFSTQDRIRFARAPLPSELPETRPVVLLFAPNGSIERVWLPVPGSSTVDTFRPTAGIQFLIGRRDGVGIGPRNVLNTPPDELPNWRDLENIWITVNSQSGMVASNPNAQVETDRNVRTSDDTTNDGNIDSYELQTGLNEARAFARQGQSMGGK